MIITTHDSPYNGCVLVEMDYKELRLVRNRTPRVLLTRYSDLVEENEKLLNGRIFGYPKTISVRGKTTTLHFWQKFDGHGWLIKRTVDSAMFVIYHVPDCTKFNYEVWLMDDSVARKALPTEIPLT